ncbi:MAG: DUF4097 family beta strand repeat protein [Lachnospiraceae bacterium]|nr:DUF4097 family beta strand repeat protein [Lachnospiraceae bacterium]
MKRKIYLTALYTVTILVILFGTLGQSGVFSTVRNSQTALSDTIYFDPASFHSIDMDLSVVDLTVKQNFDQTCSITYEASSQKLVPFSDVQNDTLKVSQTIKNTNNLKSDQLKLTLSVPAEASFENLDFELGIGDLKLENLNADNLTLAVGVGDLKVANSAFGRATIEAGVGDVAMDNCPIAKLNLEAGMGDVKLSALDDLSKYDLDISVGLGDLSLAGEKKSGFGREYIQTGDGTYSYHIESGTGDVKLSID